MRLNQLMQVAKSGCYCYMTNPNTNETIVFTTCGKQIRCDEYEFMTSVLTGYRDDLKVIKLYSQDGLICELKYNKSIFKIYKQLKERENRKTQYIVN